MQVLFVATDFVWPVVRGGQARTLSQLRVLCSLPEVAAVRFLSIHEEPVLAEHRAALARDVPKLEVLDPVFHPIHLFAHPRHVPRVAWLRLVHGRPYLAGKWDSPSLRSALVRELKTHRFDVIWFEGFGMASYIKNARSLQPWARVVLDSQDIDSDKFAQLAQRQRGLKRHIAQAEARAARRFERDAMRAADMCGTISEDDAHAYRDITSVGALCVPQVVAFERRTPARSPGTRLCFVGNLTWHANVRGLDWFCEEVWPHVRARLPDATLEIAGIGLRTDARGEPITPPAWRVPGVKALGYVSDLGPLFARSAAMVAPVLQATGVRIKLFEAFRYGAPVVTTPQGAIGLPLTAGREAFIEEDPRAFAARVVDVLTSDELQARLRESAYAFLERRHGLGAAQRVMRALLGSSDAAAAVA